MIMGSYTLIVGVLKYFLIFGGFVRLDSDPLGLSSYGAFNFVYIFHFIVLVYNYCGIYHPHSFGLSPGVRF